MNNLSEKMKERLEKWRQNTLPVSSVQKIKSNQTQKSGSGDYGDALTLEDWDNEVKRSQTRR